MAKTIDRVSVQEIRIQLEDGQVISATIQYLLSAGGEKIASRSKEMLAELTPTQRTRLEQKAEALRQQASIAEGM